MAHVFTENEKILKTTILTLKMNILTVTIVKIILRWYSDGNHGKYWWYMFKIDASVMAYINWRTATNSPPPSFGQCPNKHVFFVLGLPLSRAVWAAAGKGRRIVLKSEEVATVLPGRVALWGETVMVQRDSGGYYLPQRRRKEREGRMLRTTSVEDLETASSLPRLSMLSRRARSESMQTPDWRREEGLTLKRRWHSSSFLSLHSTTIIFCFLLSMQNLSQVWSSTVSHILHDEKSNFANSSTLCLEDAKEEVEVGGWQQGEEGGGRAGQASWERARRRARRRADRRRRQFLWVRIIMWWGDCQCHANQFRKKV